MKPNDSAKNVTGNSENFILQLRHLLQAPHPKTKTKPGAARAQPCHCESPPPVNRVWKAPGHQLGPDSC